MADEASNERDVMPADSALSSRPETVLVGQVDCLGTRNRFNQVDGIQAREAVSGFQKGRRGTLVAFDLKHFRDLYCSGGRHLGRFQIG